MQGTPQIVRLQVPGPRNQCFSTQYLQRFNGHGQYGDQHAANRHHITTLISHQPHQSLQALFVQPADHGPVHTNENHAVIIPRAKAGDIRYSLLQLPCVGNGGITKERLSDI